MASVRELLDSRQGGIRGQFGAEGHTRSFHVITDNLADDPSAVVQVTAGGTSLGAPHPWGAFGVVVIGFSERERIDERNWIVDALYGPPLVLSPAQPWHFEIDTALETYTAYRDRNGQVIGPAVYYPIPTEDEYPEDRLQAEMARIRDKLKFVTTDINRYAPTPDGYKALFIMEGEKRRATGLPRTRKTATFHLSKAIPNLSASQIASVIGMVNTVNMTPFFGASRGVAKFTGMKSRSVSGEFPGQQTPGVYYDVGLTFHVNWEKHNPSDEYDIYQHKDGTESIVEDARGGAIKRSYVLYEEMEFNTILSALG